ncbi:MAG: glycosyltransferase family 4 protein [Candidatus Cloacimonetes bacterium]|nr:glycosyltransferase family 4 protein [Candidatus Cloacimonadota bacterium]
MQVIYSIGGCVFAGKGIGQTAYQGARAFFRHNFLKKIIVPAFVSSEIPESLISKVPSNPPGLNRVFGEQYGSLIKDNLQDFLAARKIETCDIFHGWAGMSLRSGRRAKTWGAKYIVQRASSHILTQKKLLEEEYENWGIKAKPVLPQVVERNLAEYEEADYILLPSEFAKNSFLEHGVAEEKLLMIPFGTDIEKLKTPACALRRQSYGASATEASAGRQNSKLPPARSVAKAMERRRPRLRRAGKTQNSKLSVLFVGQISLRKGIPYLLQAWQELKLKNAELILVGNVTNEIQKIFRLSDSQALRITGFQDPVFYYQSADIFVFPSIEEGSALVIYEALAAGLPVITTFNSGSVVRDNIEGFIVPIRDKEALKEEILKLYGDEKLRAKMSAAARKRAEEFGWEKHGERLVDSYKQLV